MTDAGGEKIVTAGGRAKKGKTNKKQYAPQLWGHKMLENFMLRANQLIKSITVGNFTSHVQIKLLAIFVLMLYDPVKKISVMFR